MKKELDCTAAEAGKILGVGSSRVRQLVGAGRMRGARKRGPIWLFPRKNVEAFARIFRPTGNPNFKKKKK